MEDLIQDVVTHLDVLSTFSCKVCLVFSDCTLSLHFKIQDKMEK